MNVFDWETVFGSRNWLIKTRLFIVNIIEELVIKFPFRYNISLSTIQGCKTSYFILLNDIHIDYAQVILGNAQEVIFVSTAS